MSDEICTRLDKFAEVLEEIKNGNNVRLTTDDISRLRTIKNKLDLLQSVGKKYVPEKSTHKSDNPTKKMHSRSIVGSSDFFSASLPEFVPEVFNRAEEIVPKIEERGRFMISKVNDIQKIRIGCINSQLSGMIISYLINHLMGSLIGLDKAVLIMTDGHSSENKSIRSYGMEIDSKLLTAENLKKIDDMMDGKTFTTIGLHEPFVTGMFESGGDKSPELTPLGSREISDHSHRGSISNQVYCYKEVKESYHAYYIGMVGAEDPFYANFLVESYHAVEKVRSFVDYSLKMVARHVFEFIMERTNQYFYTWMLFNIDMIVCSHSISLILAMLQRDFEQESEVKFITANDSIYSTAVKKDNDYLYQSGDKTYLLFPGYSFGIQLPRQNLSLGPLHAKVEAYSQDKISDGQNLLRPRIRHEEDNLHALPLPAAHDQGRLRL